MSTDTLAIDFGTSNSAAAYMAHPGPDGVRRIAVEHQSDTLPTAVFFPSGGRPMQIGQMATDALIEGADGRYMRALKSVLGLKFIHEKRIVSGRSHTISGIITAFLSALKSRAEEESGLKFKRALSGRPVHFHSDDDRRDLQAEADLEACYLAAGFEAVSFLAEPEAAALVSHKLGGGAEVGLIVDIGGGTSDFSVFRSRGAMPEILANHGIRLGGTDFDQAVSLAHAMPLLGLGSQLNRAMGNGLLPVPTKPFFDLASWAQIAFQYTAENRRMVADMVRLADEPRKLKRLASLIEMELGHELAFAVERTKIAVNATMAPDAIPMEFVEAGLGAEVTPESLAASLLAFRRRLHQAARETLAMAEVQAVDVQQIILVGGSSLMGLVGEEMRLVCPAAEQLRSEAFTAVIDGLALATTR